MTGGTNINFTFHHPHFLGTDTQQRSRGPDTLESIKSQKSARGAETAARVMGPGARKFRTGKHTLEFSHTKHAHLRSMRARGEGN